MAFLKREVKTRKLIFRVEFELNNSLLEEQEAIDAVQRELDFNHGKVVSDLIVFLLRTTSSSTWQFGSVELLKVNEEKEKKSDL